MKKAILYSILSLKAIFFSCCTETKLPKTEYFEIPSGVIDYEEAEHNQKVKNSKTEYFKLLYATGDSRDVSEILFQQSEKKRSRKALKKGTNAVVAGEWHERGPFNEAGDIREADYQKADNSLVAMSRVGHIWLGNLDKRKWQIVNDKINFNANILKQVRKNGNRRIVAIYGTGKDNKTPRYSDDNGQTWTRSSNIQDSFHDHWGSPKKIFKLTDDKTLYYFVHTWKTSPWGSAFELFKSTDHAESWQNVLSLNGGDYNSNDVAIGKVPDKNVLYVVDKKTDKIHFITHNTGTGNHTIVEGNQNGATLPSSQTLITARITNGQTEVYAIAGDGSIYNGERSGSNITWTANGSIKDEDSERRLFRIAWMANPETNQLFAGGFQLYTSTNSGTSFTQQYDQWWEYYKKVSGVQQKDNMHVDMMNLAYFKKSNGTPFILILNHAGINISYDNLATTENLGLDGLNVVTLYDQETAPDGTMYFGAQDKGTFRDVTQDVNSNTDQIESENTTTGDGMRSIFFNNGQSWFGFLQYGSMYCSYDKDANNRKTYQIPGNNITGWINPIATYHDPSAKICYVAGGDINPNDANGANGVHLIKMQVSWTGNGSNFQWVPTQFPFDFRANSNSGTAKIRSISATPLDPNRLYVGMTDATFFYSTNGGNNWTKSQTTLPSALIAFDIEVSHTNKNVLYVSGNGFSNSAVYKSTDGGKTFTAMNNNIPNTTMESIALSSDEKYLFAASLSGPYVYDMENETWEDLSDNNTPAVNHNSVKFIESAQIARFGTFGRGVWDFVLDKNVTSTSEELETVKASIFPNPARNMLNVQAENGVSASVYTNSGVLIKTEYITKGANTIDISDLETGSYLVKIMLEDGTSVSDKLLVE